MSQETATTRSNDAAPVAFTEAFSSFSSNDLDAAEKFYGETLGLDAELTDEGLQIAFKGGLNVFIYPKPDHQPAAFTVLNLQVENIDRAVEGLTARGIVFESYGGDIETDGKGIFRGAEKSGMGPNIAWFKDPAGNILSVIENK